MLATETPATAPPNIDLREISIPSLPVFFTADCGEGASLASAVATPRQEGAIDCGRLASCGPGEDQ
jgi:hypothetical protein